MSSINSSLNHSNISKRRCSVDSIAFPSIQSDPQNDQDSKQPNTPTYHDRTQALRQSSKSMYCIAILNYFFPLLPSINSKTCEWTDIFILYSWLTGLLPMIQNIKHAFLHFSRENAPGIVSHLAFMACLMQYAHSPVHEGKK